MRNFDVIEITHPHFEKRLRRSKRLLAVLGITFTTLLSGCGGGDGSSLYPTTSLNGSSNREAPDTPEWQEGVFPDNEIYRDFCANPRTGIDPYTELPYPDSQGTDLHERNWLRSWSNEFYLWYDEIVDQDPEFFSTSEYFKELKTTQKTPSGANKDQFHFASDSQSVNAFFQDGIRVSLGIQWSFIGASTRVVYVEPSSQARELNVKRGDYLIGVDGFDIENDDSDSARNAYIDALTPILGEQHSYTFRTTDSVEYTITLTAAEIANSPVLFSNTLDTESGKVGYMVFNDHNRVAESALMETVQGFIDDGITDLVLDVRYNGGGYLYIASELAYMLAGPEATANKGFETLVFNDKYPDRNPFSNRKIEATPFYNFSTEEQPLPSLDLQRVYVITTDDTCSASESLINGLRGVDVEVIQIGSQTCGKPYGFYGQENCGTTYFSINFRGENHKGFGDYADGFIPSTMDNNQDRIRGCNIVNDDLDHALGNTQEQMLATALHFRENDACPAQASASLLRNKSAKEQKSEKATLLKNQYRTIKLF